MANIFPVLSDFQLNRLISKAEAKVYRCFREQLDDSYIILHSKSYVAPRRKGGHVDGEADFIVFSSKHGLLVVEVKGGGISYDPKVGWGSIDRNGKRNFIKDPVTQAKNQKYAILNYLKSYKPWIALQRNIPVGHAVLFPDLDSLENVLLPECPDAIIGSKTVLKDINNWLNNVYNYWKGKDHLPLGDDGLKIIEQAFCQPIYALPLLRDIIDEDNKVRIQLTHEQASVLRTLSRHKRATIVGAAGTGKTILAMEKARMLASSGAKVLLLCYNKALGVTLSRQFKQEDSIMACNFHQFCQYSLRRYLESGSYNPLYRVKSELPNEDYFDIQLPLATFYAIDELGDLLCYDAIIVDEGQDFGEEYWLPIEMALRSSEDSWLYIFYDDNQRLYSKVSTFPIPEYDTFSLTKNCRNSKPVHTLAYRYYEGDSVDDSGIQGISPIPLVSNSPQLQAKLIAMLITKLICEEAVSSDSIAVLITSHSKEVYYNLLKSEPLPKPVRWSREEHFRTNSILMDTVKRFKGLERDVIILWLEQNDTLSDSLMYVGISRAKSVLYFVGNEQTLNMLNLSSNNLIG